MATIDDRFIVHPEESGERAEHLLRGYTGYMFVVLTLGVMTLKIGRFLLPLLLPTIIEEFGIGSFRAGILLSILLLFTALLQYPGGRYSDQLSRKTVLVVSFVAAMASFLILSAATTYLLLLVGVALLGVAEGLNPSAARALLSDLFQHKRGRALGSHMAAIDLGGVIASGLSILVVGTIFWRASFLPLLAIMAITTLLLHRWNREPYTFERAPLRMRATVSRLLGTLRFRWVLVSYCLFVFSYQGVVGFLPTFLRADQGFSSSLASASFASLFVVGMIAKSVAGPLSDVTKRLYVATGGLIVAVVGLALMLSTGSTPVALISVGLFALGQKAYPPVMQAYLLDRFPDGSMGGDLGATRSIYIGVGSLGPAFVGFVSGMTSYTVAFAGLIVGFLGSALIATGLAVGE